MEPMVSIVCAAYNHKKFIRSALDGFLMQECDFPYEIIVHDDASTDGTADIIREYMDKYPGRITAILQTENQYSKGISLRENLYSKARGKYVAMCEGDDYWTDPYKLQKQVTALEAHPNIDICAAHTALSANEKIFGKIAPAHEDTILTTEQVILGGGEYVATCSLVMRKEIIMAMPESRRIISCDYVIQILGSLRGGMLYLNDCMSVYRTYTAGSWTVAYFSNRDKRISFNERMTRMLLKLDEETQGRYSSAIQYRLKELQYYHYNNEGDFKKMLSPEMREVYKKQPKNEQFKVILKCIFPWIVLKHRERRFRKARENK